MKNTMLKRIMIIGLLCASMIAGGCKIRQGADESAFQIYHVNAEGTGLTSTAYTGEVNDKEKAVKEILKKLQCTEDEINRQSAIPKDVKVEDFVITEDKLDLYFSKEYTNMDVVREVLCRAAVVRSLTQIDGISLIAFYVDGQPLSDKEGVEYGYFQAEDFVQNTGSSINSYEDKEVVLYVPNEKGDRLIRKKEKIRFNTNQSFERAVIDRLMRGADGKKANPIIPKDTKVLGVSVKDGVCYLNFDEGIKKTTPGLEAETMVYSIVNSLTEGGNVSRVQILVNGAKDVVLQEKVKLTDPLSRNLDIVEEKEN